MAATGIVFDLKRYAIHDGPGIRSTVFLLGCPLDCWWCHNPEGHRAEPEYQRKRLHDGPALGRTLPATTIGRIATVEAVMKEIMKDEIFYDQSGGGATFSGGEPMMQVEFLASLLEECKRLGVHTAVDTCGWAPARDFERVRELVDLFLYDLKLMDEEKHIRYTGVSNRVIHSNLASLAANGSRVIVRIPMIPDITDTRENLEAIAEFLEPLKSLRQVSLLPYNKLGEDKVRRLQMPVRMPADMTVQTVEDMGRKRKYLESRGYTVKLGG